jgi:hypothetical protein
MCGTSRGATATGDASQRPGGASLGGALAVGTLQYCMAQLMVVQHSVLLMRM